MATLTQPELTTVTPTHPAEPATASTTPPQQTAATVHIAPSTRGGQPTDTPASTEQLLQQRDELPAGHPDRVRLRARAIEASLATAKRLARRYAGRGERLDDLTQVAALALITAVDRYDPGRQVPFSAYAVPTILGALKRHFRDATWAMRVPRSTQELTLEIVTATAEFSQRHGRYPTTADLARQLHASIDDLQSAASASQVYRLASLNAPPSTATEVERIDLLGEIDPSYAHVDDDLAVRRLMRLLPPREQRILALRFFDHMSQTQIAAEVGLSQMQISRLLRRSLLHLRYASGEAPGSARIAVSLPASATPKSRSDARP